MAQPTGIPAVTLLAVETNYPAGGNPWNGQPIKIAPPLDYASPNVKPPVQWFNYWNNLLSQQDLNNTNLAATHAVANFDNVFASTSIDASATSVPLFFWQPYSQKWIAVVTESAHLKSYWSHDNGRTWTQELNGGYTSPIAVAACATPLSADIANPLTPTYVVVFTSSGTLQSLNQGTTGETFTSGPAITLPSAVFPQGAGFSFLGFTMSGATYTGYYATNNINTNATWANGTSGLPATWQSGTCHLNGVVSCQSSSATDSNGPRTLVAMCAVTAGTDTGRFLVVTSGGSFVDTSPTFLSSKVVTGVAYGANDNLWGVLCHDGTNSYLYTNPDPTNGSGWTLVHTFSSLNLSCGLAVLGNVWAAQVGTGTENRIMYSADVGADGVNSQWGTANAFLTGGLTVVATPGALQSSGFGLVGWSSTNLHFSKQIAPMPSGAF